MVAAYSLILVLVAYAAGWHTRGQTWRQFAQEAATTIQPIWTVLRGVQGQIEASQWIEPASLAVGGAPMVAWAAHRRRRMALGM